MHNIKTVGVAGSGTMGAGIAIVAARAGYKTIVFDTQQTALDRARKQTEGFFAKSVERKKLTQPQVDIMLANLTSTTRIDDMAACDIVIEAVFENLKVKHDLLAQLNKACPPQTIFASNTSTLSITEIAAGSGRDEKFVGMHFCLPAQLMKLIEMSPGLHTSDETFQAAWDFAKALGQIPVKTKDNPGSSSIISWCRLTTTRFAWWNRAWPRPPILIARSRRDWVTRWGRWSCSTSWGWIRICWWPKHSTVPRTSRAPPCPRWSNA